MVLEQVAAAVEPILGAPRLLVERVGISVAAVAAQVPVRPLARQVEQGRLVIVWSSVFREVRRCTCG